MSLHFVLDFMLSASKKKQTEKHLSEHWHVPVYFPICLVSFEHVDELSVQLFLQMHRVAYDGVRHPVNDESTCSALAADLEWYTRLL